MALSGSKALTERHAAVERFDRQLSTVIGKVTVPDGLQSAILAKIAASAKAPAVAAATAAKSRRRWLAWSSVALTVCLAAMAWKWSFRKPSMTLETVAAEARQLFDARPENGWIKLDAKAPPPANWPNQLSVRAIVESQEIEFLNQWAMAYKLKSQNRTALVILLPPDSLPADFAFDEVDTSGDPIKVIVSSEAIAVVIVKEKADFDIFQSQPPMIGLFWPRRIVIAA